MLNISFIKQSVALEVKYELCNYMCPAKVEQDEMSLTGS
uniref:Uncharacterized protein n=1 Tax=Arundo donax TaxID=35708 RepID=A0A0A9C897_ARUDO